MHAFPKFDFLDAYQFRRGKRLYEAGKFDKKLILSCSVCLKNLPLSF